MAISPYNEGMGVIRPRFVEQRWLQRQLLVGWPELQYERLQLELQFEQREPAEQQQPR